jgi:hypothetical protein
VLLLYGGVALLSSVGILDQTINKRSVLKAFQVIPGVGLRIAEDLWNLGYRSVGGLCGEDPETMYAALCKLQGRAVDRCMLYVFRCAVYFASNEVHEPHLLKWYNWRDQSQSGTSATLTSIAS